MTVDLSTRCAVLGQTPISAQICNKTLLCVYCCVAHQVNKPQVLGHQGDAQLMKKILPI